MVKRVPAYHVNEDGMLCRVDADQLAQHRVEQARGAEVGGHWPQLERQFLHKVSRGGASPRSFSRAQDVVLKVRQRAEESWDEPVEAVSRTRHISSWNTRDEAGNSCGDGGEHCHDQEATLRPPVGRVVVVGESMELVVTLPQRPAVRLRRKVVGVD